MYLSSKHSLPTELRRREWRDDAQGKGLWRCTPPPADLGRYTGWVGRQVTGLIFWGVGYFV